MALEFDHAQHLVWDCLEAPDDSFGKTYKHPFVTFFMDDLHQQQVVKARLEEIYKNQTVPEFVFKGKQVSFWKKADTKGKKRKTEQVDPISLPPL